MNELEQLIIDGLLKTDNRDITSISEVELKDISLVAQIAHDYHTKEIERLTDELERRTVLLQIQHQLNFCQRNFCGDYASRITNVNDLTYASKVAWAKYIKEHNLPSPPNDTNKTIV